MSDTPRTDARLMVVTDNDTCKIKVLETVRAPFVRILEREVNALTSERDKLRAEVEKVYALVTPVGFDLPGGIFETAQEVERLKRDYEYEHKCLHEVRERCESWKQRAERAEVELAKYLSACPASPTEEERKRCQQWWAVSGRSP